MTIDEFDALSSLLKGRPGAAREGARLVLVDGVPPADAARAAKVTRPAIERVLKRVRALAATGCPTCRRPVSVPKVPS
jgi:DNA-directed RNA polymerase specialized sigma24 family protein